MTTEEGGVDPDDPGTESRSIEEVLTDEDRARLKAAREEAAAEETTE